MRGTGAPTSELSTTIRLSRALPRERLLIAVANAASIASDSAIQATDDALRLVLRFRCVAHHRYRTVATARPRFEGLCCNACRVSTRRAGWLGEVYSGSLAADSRAGTTSDARDSRKLQFAVSSLTGPIPITRRRTSP